MSDRPYPVLPNFERVEQWNINAMIYHHGSLMQQSLKLFRHLGEISEGIQKMNNLDVAKGLGKYVVSLVAMASFAGINPKELAELYSESGTRAPRKDPMVIVNVWLGSRITVGKRTTLGRNRPTSLFR